MAPRIIIATRLALLLLLLLPLVVAASPGASPESFEAFVAAYGKTYASAEEYAMRAGVHAANTATIARLNEEEQAAGVVYAMNAFGDLTAAEFARSILMPPRPSPVFPGER